VSILPIPRRVQPLCLRCAMWMHGACPVRSSRLSGEVGSHSLRAYLQPPPLRRPFGFQRALLGLQTAHGNRVFPCNKMLKLRRVRLKLRRTQTMVRFHSHRRHRNHHRSYFLDSLLLNHRRKWQRLGHPLNGLLFSFATRCGLLLMEVCHDSQHRYRCHSEP
jgi:hypothetical protein